MKRTKGINNKHLTTWSSWAQAAIAAPRGTTTESLAGGPADSRATIGSFSCATRDNVARAAGEMLASVWHETTGSSLGKWFLLRNSFLFSYVRSSSACMSPFKTVVKISSFLSCQMDESQARSHMKIRIHVSYAYVSRGLYALFHLECYIMWSTIFVRHSHHTKNHRFVFAWTKYPCNTNAYI